MRVYAGWLIYRPRHRPLWAGIRVIIIRGVSVVQSVRIRFVCSALVRTFPHTHTHLSGTFGQPKTTILLFVFFICILYENYAQTLFYLN